MSSVVANGSRLVSPSDIAKAVAEAAGLSLLERVEDISGADSIALDNINFIPGRFYRLELENITADSDTRLNWIWRQSAADIVGAIYNTSYTAQEFRGDKWQLSGENDDGEQYATLWDLRMPSAPNAPFHMRIDFTVNDNGSVTSVDASLGGGHNNGGTSYDGLADSFLVHSVNAGADPDGVRFYTDAGTTFTSGSMSIYEVKK